MNASKDNAKSFLEAAGSLRLSSCGRRLRVDSQSFGEFEASDPSDSAEGLKARLDESGYLFFRGFLSQAAIQEARLPLVESLSAESALDPNYPVDDVVAAPGFESDLRAEEGRYPGLRHLPRDTRVSVLFDRLFGEKSLCIDHTWIRIKTPGRATAPHCDIVYHRKGSPRLHTIWIPLGDVPLQQGPVMILEGSHRAKPLVENYCNLDVAEGRNATRLRFRHGGFFRGGQYTKKPDAAQRELGGRWLTSDFQAGDVVVFSAFALHGALDNQSTRIRLSVDARFQPASGTVDPRWLAREKKES